jgi:toxin ParE1/3/4
VSAWYAARREGLDLEFRLELDVLLRSVTEAPEAYGKMGKRSRRALMARFPYCVYFQVRTSYILVTGVFHTHRRPGSWGDRVRESTAAPRASGT